MEYAGTKVEYEPCKWSAHTVECLLCHQLRIVGSLFVYCEDHRPIPIKTGRAVTNSAALQKTYIMICPSVIQKIDSSAKIRKRSMLLYELPIELATWKKSYTTRQPKASVWASDWGGHAINSHGATGALWRCPKKWQSSQADPLPSPTLSLLEHMSLTAHECTLAGSV